MTKPMLTIRPTVNGYIVCERSHCCESNPNSEFCFETLTGALKHIDQVMEPKPQVVDYSAVEAVDTRTKAKTAKRA